MDALMPASFVDDDFVYANPARRRVGGWVVAFVLLLAVGVVTWAVAKPYFLAREAGGPAAAQADPRVQRFVADGERALADGNLDGADVAFQKASALAERDPRVILDLARVAAAKADVFWLKLRILPADAAEEVRTTRIQFNERLAQARRAADETTAAAPDDPASSRAKIDVLRMAGERDAARSLVSKVVAQASQPETAYVLAALDLAETDPLWTTVIDRLRTAAGGEGNAGRARAALTYALARSGDAAAAKAELAKLDALSRPYPILPTLHAFLEATPTRAAVAAAPAAGQPATREPIAAREATAAGKSAEASATSPAAAPGVGAAPVAGRAVAPASEGATEASGGMQAAGRAIKRGDWSKARQIYEALVTRNPSDSEALAGIGDVDRAQGDPAGAIGSYKRALAVNPSYLPALLGVADTQWASGDRANAQRAYKDIVDRFPEGTYPAYAKSRAEGGAVSAPSGPGGAASPAGSGEENGL
jgi:tetratricopeptide (TPR) repeat protein